MTKVQIIPFSPQHADGVVSVILPIQQAEFGIPITLDAQPDLRDIPGFYQRGLGNFWVAVDGGNVVGTLALLDIGNRQAALRKMFVAGAYRGPEHGVARALLQTLLAWCREGGVRQVFLGTTAQFLAAHRFYEKNGFVQMDREALPASFPVMTVDTRFYGLTLQGDDVLQTSRVIAASPSEVFAAFENAAQLASWWGPNGFTNTFEVCEFRPGGAWRFTMHGPDGANYPNESVFVEIERDRKVVIGHVNAPRFRLTVTLTPDGAGTRVGWSQAFEDPAVAEAVCHICVPANEQNLDRLTQVVTAAS